MQKDDRQKMIAWLELIAAVRRECLKETGDLDGFFEFWNPILEQFYQFMPDEERRVHIKI